MSVAGVLAMGIAFLGDWFWGVDLFSHLRPQYCAWLGLAMLGARRLRHRAALLVAIAGVIANVAALTPYALPWQMLVHAALYLD